MTVVADNLAVIDANVVLAANRNQRHKGRHFITTLNRKLKSFT
jgi:hypothetical protein